MGTVADSLFNALMSWVRALVSDFWAIFTSERTTILEFLGKHWISLTLLLLAAGLAVDWLVWFVRWQPYRLWAQRVRRLFGGRREEDEKEDAPRAHAATLPVREAPAPQREAAQQADWPLFEPRLDEQDAQAAYARAQSVADDALGAYPGMRYDGSRAGSAYAAPEETRQFSAVRAEGPGAAEVARRREEIDEWQEEQRREEARARAEAEQARLVREAQERERQRRAQEAEAAARAREEAQRQEEQARYAREMAEYEQKRAQYEREMEEYRRKKAAYDAEIERIAQAQAAAQQAQPEWQQVQYDWQQAQPEWQQAQPAWQQPAPYEGAYAVESAQDAPDASRRRRAPQPMTPVPDEAAEDGSAPRRAGLMDRMARAVAKLEPEQSEVNAIASLPPRVDRRDAYAPAAHPPRGKRRR